MPGISPVASAGLDQINIVAGATVSLNGTGSSDDITIASYAWTSPIGITLSDSTSATPTFTAPVENNDQILVFTLTVTDDEGLVSTPDSVNISILAEVVFIEFTGPKDTFHEQVDKIFAASYELSRDAEGVITYLSIDKYDDAEYYIFDSAGARVLTLTLGNGITKSGTDFIIHVPSGALTFTGSLKHTLVAISGIQRDLVFKRDLVVKPGF